MNANPYPDSPHVTQPLAVILFGPGLFTPYPPTDIRAHMAVGAAAANVIPRNPRRHLTGFRRTPLLRFSLEGGR